MLGEFKTAMVSPKSYQDDYVKLVFMGKEPLQNRMPDTRGSNSWQRDAHGRVHVDHSVRGDLPSTISWNLSLGIRAASVWAPSEHWTSTIRKGKDSNDNDQDEKKRGLGIC